MKTPIQNSQLFDLKQQSIQLVNGEGVFKTHCADCNEEINVKYTLREGKIPDGTFAIAHKRNGRNSCSPTIVTFDTDKIPGAGDHNRIETSISIEDAFGNRNGSYNCLCGENVWFTVEEGNPEKISHRHEKCGLITELLLKYDRRYKRRTDINDHVIITFDNKYALIGKIIDYSKGGTNVKLSLKKNDHGKLMPYFQRNSEIQVIQYKGDINKSDFPYPYKMNNEDFGFVVLKLNGASTQLRTTDPNKIYKQATVVNYILNEKTNKTELKLRFY